jgi:hypothetical protein
MGLREAKVKIVNWRGHYNTVRRHRWVTSRQRPIGAATRSSCEARIRAGGETTGLGSEPPRRC